MAACCVERPACLLASQGAECAAGASSPLRDPDSKATGDGDDVMEVEVRLLSGTIAAMLAVAGADTVDSVRRMVASGRPAALLLGPQLLDPRATLADAGVRHRASLTLVRRAFTWEGARRGRNTTLELGQGGCTARRLTSYWHAVLVAASPARRFRVRVLDNADHWSGAMELGFTAASPFEVPAELPPTAYRLPRSWVVDNSGGLRVDAAAVSLATEAPAWNAKNLRAGDVVAVEASEDGALRVEVNGSIAREYPTQIGSQVDLYPIVGLFGMTRAVELLDD